MKYNIRDARKLIGRIAKQAASGTPFGSIDVTAVTTGSDGWNAKRVWPIIEAIGESYKGSDTGAIHGGTTDAIIMEVNTWLNSNCDIAGQLSDPHSHGMNEVDWTPLFIGGDSASDECEAAQLERVAEAIAPSVTAKKKAGSTSVMEQRLAKLRQAQQDVEDLAATELAMAEEIPVLRKEVKDLATAMGNAIAKVTVEATDQAKKIAKTSSVDVSSLKGLVGDAVVALAASGTATKDLKKAAKVASELPKLYSVDPTFVKPEWFDRFKCWINAGIHVAVGGSTGAGKTFPAKQACAALGLPCKTIAMNGGIDAETLVAIPHLKGGTSTYVDGFLTHAMRHGYALILDEADSLRQEEALVLNDASESRMITVPFTGEVVEAKDGFVIIYTSNSLGDELGVYNREGFDASLLNRCRMVLAKPLSVAQEVKILTSIKCPAGHAITSEQAKHLAQWAKIARTAHFGSQGQDAVLKTNPSTRVLVNTVAEWLGFNPETNKLMPPAKDDDAFKDDIRKALHFTFASCLDEDERTALKGLDLWVWDK